MISLHRFFGATNIAAALRHHSRDALRPLQLLKIICFADPLTDGVRDDLRDYVVEHFGETEHARASVALVANSTSSGTAAAGAVPDWVTTLLLGRTDPGAGGSAARPGRSQG
ncbi:hypothetical protein [Pseudonocardia sp. NPDC049635]|uniref:hypothetical protein n=1 Tax=Pseudonocardia sp. NPDC049635 TaxID=3155506 RepID=UPI00340F7E2E